MSHCSHSSQGTYVSPVVETLWIKKFFPMASLTHLCINDGPPVEIAGSCGVSPHPSTDQPVPLHMSPTTSHLPSPGKMAVIHTIHNAYDDDYLSSQKS